MTTTSPTPRRQAGRGSLGVLVAVIVAIAALAAAAFWLRPALGDDDDARISTGEELRGGSGMSLPTPEPRPSESIEEAVTAPAREAAAAAEVKAAEAEIEFRAGVVEGRVVSLDGSAVPSGLFVHLRWTRPSPRLRTLSIATAREATYADEAEIYEGRDNSREALRARDASLRLVTRTPVLSDGSFRIARVPRMASWVQVEHETLWAPTPPRIAGLPRAVESPDFDADAGLSEPFDFRDVPDEDDPAPSADARTSNAGAVAAAEPLVVEVAVTAGAALVGRVVDSDGEPVSGASLTAAIPMDPFTLMEGSGKELRVDAARSADDGAFRLGPLPSAQTLRVDVEAVGDLHGTSLAIDALRTGEQRELTLVLPTGGRVTGVVVEEDETPVVDAEVRLLATDLSAMSFGSDGRSPEISRDTDAQGRFAFQGVFPGSYRLVVASVDHVPTLGEAFELVAGEPVDGVRLVVRRGLSVSGVVLDARGEPVAGAQIQGARPPSMMDVSANLDRAYRKWKDVDADGHFAISGFEPGDVRVRARSDGYVGQYLDVKAGSEDVRLTLGDTCAISGIAMDLDTGDPLTSYTLAAYAGDGSFNMADMFELQERFEASKAPVRVRHEEGRFKLDGLTPGVYTLMLTAEGHGRVLKHGVVTEPGQTTSGVILMVPLEGRITGTVIDARSGAPLEGAMVTTGGTDMLSTYKEAFSGAAPRTQTDADGRFELDGLSEEYVTVTAQHQGHIEEAIADVFPRSGQTLDVGLLRLASGAVIYGRLLDERGLPTPGVTVIAGDATGRTTKRSTSDADGNWRIEGLPPGSYRVTRLDFTVDLGSGDGTDFLDEIVTRSVTLAASEERELDMGRAEAGGTRLEGTVRSADGPQPKAVVFALRQDGEAEVRFATADDQGRYSINGLEPGEYLLQVLPDMQDMQAGSQPSAPVSDVIDVKDLIVQTHDLRLPSGVLEVSLRDEDGHGVDGVRVVLERTDAGRTASRFLASTGNRTGEAYSKDGGRCRFAHLATGTYTLAIGGRNLLGMGDAGWAFQRLPDVRVMDGKPASTVSATLRPGAGIEGVVTDSHGKPLAGIPVWARDESTGTWLSLLSETNTDHTGTFHLDGLEPGPWSLAVGGTSHAFTRVPTVMITRAKVEQIEVTLGDGVEIFVEPGPYSLRDLTATVSDVQGSVPLELASMDSLLGSLTAGGRLRVGRLALGTYDLTVMSGPTVVRSGSISLGLGDDPYTITLEEP